MYILILAIILSILIGKLVIDLGKPVTASQYVTNTYMYVILAILLYALISMLLYNKINYNGYLYFGLFILSIVLIYLLNNSTNVIGQHIYWLLFILILAIITSPIINKADLWKTVITITILVASLAYYASTVSINAFDKWQNYLLFGLLALIIFRLLGLMFGQTTSIYNWFAIVLFSAFILYDLKNVQKRGIIMQNLCQNSNQSCKQYINYPNDSLQLFLDVLNIFTSMSSNN